MVKTKKLMQSEAIRTQVRPQGNGACAYVPKAWIGKMVRIELEVQQKR